MIELGQEQIVELRANSTTVTDHDGNPVGVDGYHVDQEDREDPAADKGGYDHFMLKEIAEQPRAVAAPAFLPA